ncbi:unnamed protein product, partial [Strongylus vulgaris]
MFAVETIRRTGVIVCILSFVSMAILLVTVMNIYERANTFHSEAMARSQAFAKKSQVIWAEMSEINRVHRIPRDYGSVSTAEELKKGVLHKCS